MICDNCGKDSYVKINGVVHCSPECEKALHGEIRDWKLADMLKTRRCPFVKGLSDGPDSGKTEMVFDRPDVRKETKHTLSIMEENGQLKDPERMAAAQASMKAVEHIEPTRDYGTEGHAVDHR